MFITDPGLVPLTVTSVDGRQTVVPDLWWLDGPLVWESPEAHITIPAGFISDDASVPKFLDWVRFLDRQGLSRRPGLCHDGLYSLGRARGKDFADRMLRAFCLAEGMTALEAGCYYQGVHLFGGSSWQADAVKDAIGVQSGDFVSELAYQRWLADGATIFR